MESGTNAELMDVEGVYYSLINRQVGLENREINPEITPSHKEENFE